MLRFAITCLHIFQKMFGIMKKDVYEKKSILSYYKIRLWASKVHNFWTLKIFEPNFYLFKMDKKFRICMWNFRLWNFHQNLSRKKNFVKKVSICLLPIGFPLRVLNGYPGISGFYYNQALISFTRKPKVCKKKKKRFSTSPKKVRKFLNSIFETIIFIIIIFFEWNKLLQTNKEILNRI